MSTRCQVQVFDDNGEKISLYHHCDGFPHYMLELFQRAYEKAISPTVVAPGIEHDTSWQAERAGKSASFLCWADPGEFEPELGDELHCDIEYLYLINVGYPGRNRFRRGGKPVWKVEVLVPKYQFFNSPHVENMRVLHKRRELSKLLEVVRCQEKAPENGHPS